MTTEAASSAPPHAEERICPPGGFAERYPILYALFGAPSPRTILLVSLFAFALYATIIIRGALESENFVLPGIAVIGGDFTVFWMAAKTLFAEGPGALYQPGVLNERLGAAFPTYGQFSLFWQYPPTIYFLVAPLAALPYPAALAAWGAATAGFAAGVIRSLWRARLPLIVGFASAAAYQGWITGQTGFLTAALLTLAAGHADRRPLIAGIAAGLLTFKPQLGLLIPVAYAAAGCWRAFGAAAVTGVLMAGLSVLFFGADTWLAFFDAITAHGERMSELIFPDHKLITPYGFFMTLGALSSLAFAVQAAASLALAVFVFMVWRRSDAWETRLFTLIPAAALATPYAFYYEAPIFIPALIILAKRAMEKGWLPFEKQALIALWFLPVLTPGPHAIPVPAMIAFAAFAICARRAAHECGFKLPQIKAA
ncbi:glycosyltransferase family 87 protein [Marinicaulis aureus]|uniref:Glycosyltransferase family 87 protein n=1 Tax=Hyphococcus aureus TaxID=2666033 RepID=A0ABW1KS31_9PROT